MTDRDHHRVFRIALLSALATCGCAAPDRADPPADVRTPSRRPEAPSSGQDEWLETARRHGIVVSRRYQRGAALPALRAVGEIDAGIYEVFAVLHDADRHADWIYRCRESKVLERTSETEGVLYNRLRGLPPIVADRDVVLAARASSRAAGREILIEFESVDHELKRDVAGVVRMPKMEGHYRLTAVSGSRTEVEYQVYADPGGLLFDWIKRAAIETLPLKTLTSLREQVARTHGEYRDLVKAWRERI